MKYRAVLFDFDGVIAKTMEDNFVAWQTVLADYGYALRPEDYFPWEGEKLQDLATHYCLDGGIDVSLAPEIVQKKDEYYKEHNTFVLYSGAKDVLTFLASRGIPLGLVTAGRRDRVEHSMPQEILKSFSALITNENGGRGKPFPDPYERGAEILNIPPAECVVIENAPLGIKAAKAAGSYCIAISSTLSKDDLYEADVVVEAIGDIITIEAIKDIVGF